MSKDRLLADVAVYECLENVACSSSGEEGADEDVEVVERVSNSSCEYVGFVFVLSEKGSEEDFREARSVCDEDCKGLEEKCEAPW